MKRKLPLFCAGLLWLSTLASAQMNVPDTIPTDRLKIDPQHATGGAAGDLFQQVTYIPLETSGESLLSQIDQLIVTDTYFIILDRSKKAILFYDKTGKFHHKLDRFHFDKIYKIPAEPGVRDYTIWSVSTDARRQHLYIQTIFERQFLYVYSFDGRRLDKIALPPHTKAYHFLEDGTGIYVQERPASQRLVEEYAPFDLSIRKSPDARPAYFLPVNFRHAALKDDLYGHMNYLTEAGSPSQCFYIPDFDYGVYELDTAGIRHKYQFVFPQQYSLPDNFGYDSSYVNRRRAYLDDKNMFACVWNLYKTGNYLMVDLRFGSGKMNPNNFSLLYSLKTGRSFTLDGISPDATSQWLPVSGAFTEVLACDSHHVYISLPSQTMFTVKESADKKHVAYSDALKNYFNTQNGSSNPVIVQLTPRANL